MVQLWVMEQERERERQWERLSGISPPDIKKFKAVEPFVSGKEYTAQEQKNQVEE